MLPGDAGFVPETRAVLDKLDADLADRLALCGFVSILPCGWRYFPHCGGEGDVMMVMAVAVGGGRGALDCCWGLAGRRRLGRQVAFLRQGRLRVREGDGDGGVAAAGTSADVMAVLSTWQVVMELVGVELLLRAVLLVVVGRMVKVGAAAQHQLPSQGGEAGHREIRGQQGTLGGTLCRRGDRCSTARGGFGYPGGRGPAHLGWRLTLRLGRGLRLAAGNCRRL